MELFYTARFLRSLKKLSDAAQKDTIASLRIYRSDPSNALLHLHKLSGKWKGYHAISVGFRYRIVLKITKRETYCMDIGTHDVYR